MKAPWSGVLRACGFCWLENDPESVSQLTVSGGSRRIRRAGTWWVGTGRKYWPREKDRLARMRENWHPDFGDRVQEIAVIGLNMDEDALRASFDQALLTEHEVEEGGWTRSAMTPDPFFGLL